MLYPMKTQDFQKLYHCTYALNYHLVIVTKYRKKCLTKDMLEKLRDICEQQVNLKGGTLVEFNGEDDHLHLLITLPPNMAVATLVNSLKTVTSRLMRRDYATWLSKFYWKKVLWSRSYFVSSCGGAPLTVIKQYIQQQEEPGE